ncbi:hypothetical protein FBUS_08318 [Fasciolopsis buskii]|uniref:Uncharacterized protein n=1 Tax=Fasciolopsis buskii TaxID=27845 RepID=A0A8E0RUL2_9TREM|nr:hypothetical protein FBUS_08318 [Fasciolopsis buski]
MQMMRLNGPVIVKSCSQPPTSLAIPAPIQSPATTATPLSSAVDPFCANDTKLDHTPLATLRSDEVNRRDLGEDDEFLYASDEKQPSRMNGTNGVKIRHARSKSSGTLSESRIEQLLVRKEQLKNTVAKLETKLDELRSQNSYAESGSSCRGVDFDNQLPRWKAPEANFGFKTRTHLW